ncbi:hypothetical protein GGI35DRAFT_10772 [Trichoderma velutinum]
MLASSWDRPQRRTASLSPPSWLVVGLGSELLLLLRLMLTRTRTCVLAPIRARPAVSGVRLDRTMPYRTWTVNQSNRYLRCSSARACCVFCALQLMPGHHTCAICGMLCCTYECSYLSLGDGSRLVTNDPFGSPLTKQQSY